MSHHSDEAMLIATSDSFWEPGNFKKTTKRTEDGFKLCNDLVLLIQERSEIEKMYAKNLRTWSKKWNELIEKGPEYGTTEAGWKGVLIEAERRCDMHMKVRDRLINEVVAQIKQWQKDNYQKSMMALKQKKDFDDAFKKVQKPWAKMLSKVNKCKTDYHNACKNERTAINQERNASGDTSLSPDQVKRLQDRVTRSKEEVIKTKEKYEMAIKDINSYNGKYIEDMTMVFDKCQEFEEKRLNFFKDVLFAIHGCLNIDVSTDPDLSLPKIYEEYRHTIQNADSAKDLKWWSNNFGVDMAMSWPLFEEYSEEFRDIVGKTKKTAASVPENGITLVNQHKFNEELPEYTPELQNISKKEKKANDVGITLLNHRTNNMMTNATNNHNNKMSNNPNDNGLPMMNMNMNMNMSNNKRISAMSNSNGKVSEVNPFDDDHEDWDDDYPNDALVDNGEPGVPVRALYDYKGAESDELTFKQGDIFDKLEDEDEQGWCKGRKDGRVGLYPSNYCVDCN